MSPRPGPGTTGTPGGTGPPGGSGSARPGSAGRALALVAVSTFLAMTVWFSASAVVPQLAALWQLGAGGSALLTVGVQLGFVVGALAAAATGLADALPGRVLMTIGATGAALANACLVLADGPATALPARLLTGVCLALVYPPALKEVSTWFTRGRGTALGVMVGALTLGSALPNLLSAGGGPAWQVVVLVTSGLTLAGGALMLALRTSGPHARPRTAFDVRAALASLRSRPVLLADLGYVGHMWELYAMWAWVGAFLASLPAVAALARPQETASLLAFACIGVGALGCLLGGVLGDRYGRATSALVCLVCSGAAALALSLLRAAPLGVVLTLCVLWGFWVVADSAQFSALVTERADPAHVGSAVSVQLALGYLTTAVTVWLVPVLVEARSWSVALAVLAVGPVVGGTAMLVLLRDDRAARAGDATGRTG